MAKSKSENDSKPKSERGDRLRIGSDVPAHLWHRLGTLAENWRPRTTIAALLEMALEDFLAKYELPAAANPPGSAAHDLLEGRE